jgi:hypothetical protein
VTIDDLKNPEYRKGRRRPPPQSKPEPLRQLPPSEEIRRAEFAAQAARAAFGRFYWNDGLGRRMKRELEKARRRRREEAEQVSARRRNGARR